jgi:diguanylate cyclase (GGDEF)-like protein
MDEWDLGRISMSLGVAFLPDHGTEVEHLLRAADSALYGAKKAGRNRVALFQGSPKETQ